MLLFLFVLFRHFKGASLTPLSALSVDNGSNIGDTHPVFQVLRGVNVVVGTRSTLNIITSLLGHYLRMHLDSDTSKYPFSSGLAMEYIQAARCHNYLCTDRARFCRHLGLEAVCRREEDCRRL